MGERLTESAERYLEAVYILERTDGAIAARVAERLGVRAPSVTQALRRLQSSGWLRIAADRSLHLTEVGTRLAEQVMRRHRVIERWLVDGLGLDWARAHSEAQRMEHAVSPETIDRLYETMGRPDTCPHGNPIPGPDGLPPYAGATTLDAVGPGSVIRVARIAEDAEETASALAEFERLGLRPGARLEVRGQGDGQVRVSMGGDPRGVPVALASKVWVDPDL